MAEFPNVYSCSAAVNVSSTTGTVHTFGFAAKFVRIDNLSAVNMYLNPQNAAASTTGYYISTCQAEQVFEWYDSGRQTLTAWAGVGLMTTSTGAGGALANVFAIG